VLGGKQQIPLSEELRLVESFLNIERVRYGKRLSVVRQVGEECNACLIPPLLIQPLVENAIRHGIAPLIEGGTLRIDVHREGPENVRSRLSRLFSNQAHVAVSRDDGRFLVRLRFPCIQAGETT
jgi:hypothetical protein